MNYRFLSIHVNTITIHYNIYIYMYILYIYILYMHLYIQCLYTVYSVYIYIYNIMYMPGGSAVATHRRSTWALSDSSLDDCRVPEASSHTQVTRSARRKRTRLRSAALALTPMCPCRHTAFATALACSAWVTPATTRPSGADAEAAMMMMPHGVGSHVSMQHMQHLHMCLHAVQTVKAHGH